MRASVRHGRTRCATKTNRNEIINFNFFSFLVFFFSIGSVRVFNGNEYDPSSTLDTSGGVHVFLVVYKTLAIVALKSVYFRTVRVEVFILVFFFYCYYYYYGFFFVFIILLDSKNREHDSTRLVVVGQSQQRPILLRILYT